jgi:hypothetical protein
MNYTDPKTGANYPASWWKLAQVNINYEGRVSTIIWHGWASKDCIDEGMLPIHVEILTMNDPANFEQYMVPAVQQIANQALDYNVRQVTSTLWNFFSGATEYSSVAPVASFQTVNTRVVVQFTQEVLFMSGALKDGVTVKVNGVSRTVTAASAALVAYWEVYFDLASPVLPGDVVTWEYDAAVGHWGDGMFLPMPSQYPMAVQNLLLAKLAAFAVHGHSLVTASARTTFGVVALIPGRSVVASGSRMTFSAAAAVHGHSLVTAIGTKTP